MFPKSQTSIKFSNITSILEGQDIGEMKRLWKDTAACEARIKQMSVLKGKKLGFQEVENFGLGLKYSFKSEKMREKNDKPVEKVIEAAMAIKIKDERFHQRELYKIKEIKKKRLGEQHHPKTKKYKKVIQYLRQEAEETKKKQNEKFEEKIKHIERKYRETEE